MEWFIALGIAGLICWAIYRHAKRIGSQKGYSVGRFHAQRHRI